MQPSQSPRTNELGAALPVAARACGALACALALAACGGTHKDSSKVSNRPISVFSWAFAAAPNSLDVAKDGLIAQTPRSCRWSPSRLSARR